MRSSPASSRTGVITRSAQVYSCTRHARTARSRRAHAAAQPASPKMYGCDGWAMKSAQLCSPQHSQRTAVRCTSHIQPSCAAGVITRARAGTLNNLRCTAVRMVSHQRRSCAAMVTQNAQLCSSSHTECTAVRSCSLGTYGHSGCCTGHVGPCASGNMLATRVRPLTRCKVGRVFRDLKIPSACHARSPSGPGSRQIRWVQFSYVQRFPARHAA